MTEVQGTGVLYVVATPIGNRADMSPRALEVLGHADAILAEDTRRSGRLLAHYGIQRPLISLHEHNEPERVPGLLDRLAGGAVLALVSDAGTPLISDPGFRLVRAAREAGHRVTPIPGPCSPIAALSVAGIPTDRFVFEGFLPAKQGERRARLQALAAETRTVIFFESSHRIDTALEDMIGALGAERRACLTRELTKLHETILFGSLAEVAARVASDRDQRRGEFVVVVEGAAQPASMPDRVDLDHVLDILLQELTVRQAAALAAKITGHSRNHVYRLALARQQAGP